MPYAMTYCMCPIAYHIVYVFYCCAGLFRYFVGLFCYWIGLFCCWISLLCCWIGLFWNMSWHDRSLLLFYRSLLLYAMTYSMRHTKHVMHPFLWPVTRWKYMQHVTSVTARTCHTCDRCNIACTRDKMKVHATCHQCHRCNNACKHVTLVTGEIKQVLVTLVTSVRKYMQHVTLVTRV